MKLKVFLFSLFLCLTSFAQNVELEMESDLEFVAKAQQENNNLDMGSLEPTSIKEKIDSTTKADQSAQNSLATNSSAPDSSVTDSVIQKNQVLEEAKLEEFAYDSTISEDQLEVVKLPIITKFVEAEYPKSFIKTGFVGSVILELLVNEKGKVDSVSIVKKLEPVLDSLAMQASYGFEFIPARLNNGDSVAVLLQYRYDYKIDQVIKKVDKYINLEGIVKAKGGGYTVSDAEISITYADTTQDSTLEVPFSFYMQKIGAFEEQQVDEKTVYTTTLEGGKFNFYSLPTGKVIVEINHPDYKTVTEELEITRDKLSTTKFYMDKSVSGELEILVIGKKEKKEVIRRNLSLQEVKRVPGVGGDALKVVQALPGVARSSFGGGDIIMRGANTNDSRFLLDGISLPWLYHYGGLKSVYNSEALEGIEIYPGGFGTRYGGATAGIVEIKSRDGSNDHFQGFVDVNFLDASFLLEGPIRKDLTFLVSARRSYFGSFVEWASESGMFNAPLVVTPYYWDYTAKLTYELNKNHKFSINFVGAMDDLKVTVPSLKQGSTEISSQTDNFNNNQMFNSLLLSYKVKISDDITNELIYSIMAHNLDLSIFSFGRLGLETLDHNLRDQLTIKQNKHLKYNVGLDLVYKDGDYKFLFPTGDGTFVKDTLSMGFGPMGVYANVEITPIENLLITPGLRLDYYPELEKYNGNLIPVFSAGQATLKAIDSPIDLSARLSARYKINKKVTVKGALGNYNQTPQPIGQVGSEKWGNPLIGTTKASHYVLGGEYNFTDIYNIDVQAYRNYQFNIPRTPTNEETLNSGSQIKAPKYFDDGKGIMTGLEILFKHEFDGMFFGWIAYTLSRSERYNFEEKQYSLYEKDQTHNIQVLGSWKLPKKWDLGFKARYVTGNPETPVIGSYYDADDKQYVPIYGEKFSSRVDPFVQLDIRVDKAITFNNLTLDIYLDVQNILYPLYVNSEFTTYNYDYTKQQIAGGPMIPALGVKVSF